MTEVELLALDSLPDHLVIIGGGYIGLEFGQMFRRFGARVTIITGSRVAPREDEDISDTLAEMLTDEGVDIIVGRPARVGTWSGAASRCRLATTRRSWVVTCCWRPVAAPTLICSVLIMGSKPTSAASSPSTAGSRHR